MLRRRKGSDRCRLFVLAMVAFGTAAPASALAQYQEPALLPTLPQYAPQYAPQYSAQYAPQYAPQYSPQFGQQYAGYEFAEPSVVRTNFTADDAASDVDASMMSTCEHDSCCCCRDCTLLDSDCFYVSFSGGWQHRERVHEASDARTFLEFNEGFVANAALGYRFDTFRTEIEYSFMNNDVDTAGASGLSSEADGNVNLKAFMFNVYHDIQLKCGCWTPYVGAGVGIYQSEINSLYPGFFDVAGAPFAGTAVNTTSDMPLAYQFRAGASRPLTRRSELFVGYRYFRGEELTFAAPPFSVFAPTFHPNAAKNHSIEMGLRINF